VTQQQHLHHQPRIKRRTAPTLFVTGVEPRQVQMLIDHISDKPGEVLLQEPLIRRRRDQQQLIRLEPSENLVHRPHSTTSGSTGVTWKRPSSSHFAGTPKSPSSHRICEAPRPVCFVPTLLRNHWLRVAYAHHVLEKGLARARRS